MEQFWSSITKQIFFEVEGKNKKAGYDLTSTLYRSKNTIHTVVQWWQSHTELEASLSSGLNLPSPVGQRS